MRPHSCPKFLLGGGTYKTVLFIGDAENAAVENAARSKLQGVENAGMEILGGRLFERM